MFSTHATDILDAGVLRRDQIYITEKNDSGATIVNNLAEYKVHKDTVLSKRYLEGRYGGIPYLHEGYFEQADDLVKDSLRPSAPGGDK